MMKTTPIVLFLFAVICHRISSIRITRFMVPGLVSVNEPFVDLLCGYDLENDRLYEVQWYKNGEEFFRCRSDGTVQTFEAGGVEVMYSTASIIGSCPVSLTSLSFQTSGQYKCEVMSEGPRFKVDSRTGIMKVKEIVPSRRVHAHGLQHYENLVPENVSAQPSGSGNHHGEVPQIRAFIIFYLLLYIFATT